LKKTIPSQLKDFIDNIFNILCIEEGHAEDCVFKNEIYFPVLPELPGRDLKTIQFDNLNKKFKDCFIGEKKYPNLYKCNIGESGAWVKGGSSFMYGGHFIRPRKLNLRTTDHTEAWHEISANFQKNSGCCG
jgi:hypothetical protein